MGYQKKTILIVDGNSHDRKTAAEILELNGFTSLTAIDGESASEIVKKEKPDLVILEAVVLRQNGHVTFRQIKTAAAGDAIPVLMAVPAEDRSVKERCVDSGADDFISKPFEKSELLIRVNSLLRIKTLHDELSAAVRKLNGVETIKNDLLHIIVQDLANPLLTIAGRIQILLMSPDKNFSEVQKGHLETVFTASQDLKRMIGNILDVNRMEEGLFKLKPEKFNLARIVAEVVEQMSILAAHSDKKLSLESDEYMPGILADREVVRRIVSNLITNALKFTPARGTVFVKALFREDEGIFYVQIKDSGEGIPAEDLETIFNKFSQVGTGSAKVGRGLSLAFCKMAVEAHGGKIWAKSAPGKGSLFTFTLPEKCFIGG